MLEALFQGIVNVLNPGMLPWVFLGVIVGLIVGILPGLGIAATLAILLPVVYGLNPTFALTLNLWLRLFLN
jgi:putative tricarboxylic transport membrane protein